MLHGVVAAGVAIAADEVLQEQLGVLEVRGLVVVGLAVDLGEGVLEVVVPPDEAADVCVVVDVPSCLRRYSFCLTSS